MGDTAMHPERTTTNRSRAALSIAALGAAVLLTGCSLVQPVSKEDEALQYATKLAAGSELVCRYERPIGSRVKQQICMTPQEADLRDLQARTLYRNSLVAIHGGAP
jgi:hypothetical protein